MSTVILQSTATISEPQCLAMRGVQTDAYNTVLGGHKVVFDPLQSGVASLANGASLPNIVSGAAAATASGTDSTITADKGMYVGTGFGVLLPTTCDFLQLGSQPSILIAIWATWRTHYAGATGAILAGYGLQSSTRTQWRFLEAASTGIMSMFINAGGGPSVTFGLPTLGTPTLLAAYVKKTAAGIFELDGYFGPTAVASYTDPPHGDAVYPFNDPQSGGATTGPALGGPAKNGYPAQSDAVIHRFQLAKVDPSTFNFANWVTAEIAGNGSRFV